MKEFEEMDVFIPGDDEKWVLKMLYNAFYAIFQECSKQLKEQRKLTGALLMDYVPYKLKNLLSNYAVDFYYDEEADILYLGLYWISKKEGDPESAPITFVNVSMSDNRLSMSADATAYVFMVACIDHVGILSDDHII